MNRKNTLPRQKWLMLLTLFGFLVVSPHSWGQIIITINSLSDRSDATHGDGVCFTGFFIDIEEVQEQECTLRAAIEEANQASDEVVIEFSPHIEIDEDGLSIIQPQSPLPFISNQITLAGETHPLFETNSEWPGITINGEDAGTTSGLRFLAGGSGSTVRHVSIGNFSNSGISLVGGSGYTITDNLIGAWVSRPPGSSLRVALRGNGGNGIIASGASAPGGSNVSFIVKNWILGSDGDAISLVGGTAAAVVAGNFIGLVPAGSGPPFPLAESSNGQAGIRVGADAGSSNFLGDFFGTGPNYVANSGNGGIWIETDGQSLLGNHVGVPVNGVVHPNYELSDYGNAGNGVYVHSSDNIIGGEGAALNVIGTSQFVGIRVGDGGASPVVANNNQIRRNLIGVMPDGQAVGQSQGIRIDNGSGNTIIGAEIANNITGIEFRDAGNSASKNMIVNQSGTGVWFRAGGTLGGNSFEVANVIGNNNRGVEVTSTGTDLVTIRNNYIGTNPAGDDLGNDGPGVLINGTNTVDIGGSNSGNIIGYNLFGIYLRIASEAWILGNRIGIHANGQEIPNGTGIRIGTPNVDATDNRIGYLATQDIPEKPLPYNGNIIAFNVGHGIDMDDHADATLLNNSIRGNNIFANGGEGIYLGPDGGTVDEGGGNSGPNGLQNFPVFDDQATFYSSANNALTFRYQVRTLATNASYPLVIDFYLAASGDNQGQTYLGTHTYLAENAMDYVDDILVLPEGIQVFGNLVATATDQAGNTSQFSSEPVFLGEQKDSIFGDRFQN